MYPGLVIHSSRLGLSGAVKLATDWTCMCLAEGVLACLRKASDFLKRVEQAGIFSRFISSSSNLKELGQIEQRLANSQQPLQLALQQSVRCSCLLSRLNDRHVRVHGAVGGPDTSNSLKCCSECLSPFIKQLVAVPC